MAFPLALPCPGESLFHDPNGTAFADPCAAGMLPLPVPQRGGSIEASQDQMNSCW